MESLLATLLVIAFGGFEVFQNFEHLLQVNLVLELGDQGAKPHVAALLRVLLLLSLVLACGHVTRLLHDVANSRDSY